MFAHAEEVQADLIRQNPFLDDVPQRLRLGQLPAVGRDRDVAKRIYPELDRVRHVPIVPRPQAATVRAKIAP
jgi:hypothetical protein